jgi:hercynylcysteine S-oxide lyase
VYVWVSLLNQLEPRIWSYDDFVREKLHRWVGPNADAKEYEAIPTDDSKIPKQDFSKGTKVLVASDIQKNLSDDKTGTQYQGKLEEFGKKFGEKYFCFEKGWLNLNHGKTTHFDNIVVH